VDPVGPTAAGSVVVPVAPVAGIPQALSSAALPLAAMAWQSWTRSPFNRFDSV